MIDARRQAASARRRALPPPAPTTPERLAQAFFRLPAGYKWRFPSIALKRAEIVSLGVSVGLAGYLCVPASVWILLKK